MSEFSEAMAVADAIIWAEMGAATGVYTRPGSAGTTVSVIIDHAQQLVAAGPGEVSEWVTVAHLLTEDLAFDPARGDGLAIGTERWAVDRVLARDEDNLVVTVELTRQ